MSSNSNSIKDSVINVTGDLSMISINLENDSLEAINELLKTLSIISTKINKLNSGVRRGDKYFKWEVNNYLLPDIENINNKESTESDYIWDSNGDSRFWQIDLKNDDKFSKNLDELERQLSKGNFKKADIETTKLVIDVAQMKSKNKRNWLSYKDFNKIPIELLYNIDQLWLFYSKRKFGLTIQCKIWGHSDDDFQEFGSLVGWKRHDDWIFDYERLNFSLEAPAGHLPSFRSNSSIGAQWYSHWERNYTTVMRKLHSFIAKK